MTKELIIRFLNNQCTEEELKEIFKWVNSESLKKESIDLGFEVWNSIKDNDNEVNTECFDVILDKIEKEGSSNYQSHKLYKKLSPRLSAFLNVIYKAAAILLIPVLFVLFYSISQKKQQLAIFSEQVPDTLEISTPFGSRTKVQLVDGTEVHLNYGSSLKYPVFFKGNTRDVVLSGEGYFDVATNPEQPFNVKINNFNIKAVGTSFNVYANLDKNIIETTLVEGKLILEHSTGKKEFETVGIMNPGQHIKYNVATGKKKVLNGSIEKYISWKDGKIIFEDSPILEVAERLNRIYNVDISVTENVKVYTYTFTYEDMPLFQVLDLMCLAAPIKYQSIPRKKLSDGTYSKQKIMIENRKLTNKN